MKAYKLEIYEGASPLIDASIENLVEMVKMELESDELTIGNRMIIETVEIDEEDYKNLPEWDGP